MVESIRTPEALPLRKLENSKVILIGGTSHVGKSTLGRRLAEDLHWNYLSTDQLARHPGRPWRAGDDPLPNDVVEHYTELSTPQLVDSVLTHYRSNVWPIVAAIIHSRLNNPFDLGLVLEGSAVLPEMVDAARHSQVAAIWLTAPRSLIKDRIRQGSVYEARGRAQQRLVDAFLERTLAIDELLTRTVETNGQKLLDAGLDNAFDSLRLLVEPGGRA